jgi:hypothetical protein
MVWEAISKYQRLSEDFIREFQVKNNWDLISKYQRLSEGFIREFQDKINLESKFSENFIRDHPNLSLS